LLSRSPSRYFIRGKQFLNRRKLPPIFLNTMPKSRSIFLAYSFAYGLFLKYFAHLRKPGDDSWYRLLNAEIDPERIRRFAAARQLSQDHIPSTPQNRKWLGRHLDRFVVHLRDPRQATLSMIHHVLKDKKEGNPVDDVPKCGAPDYFERDLEGQIDVQLDRYLSSLVDFAEGWLDTDEDLDFSPQILFCNQEDLRLDGEAFVARILDFYGLNGFELVGLNFPKPGEMHFRKGLANEWQTVFTRKQQDKAAALISVRLAKAFNWVH